MTRDEAERMAAELYLHTALANGRWPEDETLKGQAMRRYLMTNKAVMEVMLRDEEEGDR